MHFKFTESPLRLSSNGAILTFISIWAKKSPFFTCNCKWDGIWIIQNRLVRFLETLTLFLPWKFQVSQGWTLNYPCTILMFIPWVWYQNPWKSNLFLALTVRSFLRLKLEKFLIDSTLKILQALSRNFFHGIL